MTIGSVADKVLSLGWKALLVGKAFDILPAAAITNVWDIVTLIVGGTLAGTFLKFVDAILSRFVKLRGDLVKIDDASHKGRADDCEERELRYKERLVADDAEFGRLYGRVSVATETLATYQRMHAEAIQEIHQIQGNYGTLLAQHGALLTQFEQAAHHASMPPIQALTIVTNPPPAAPCPDEHKEAHP